LARLGIATSDSNGRWSADPLHEALIRLDRRWDEIFGFDEESDADIDDEATAESDGEPAVASGGDGALPLIRFRRVVDRFRNRLGERLIDS
jgi:hypothetical protein